MNLPSRGERESATTTRYTGFFFDPTRVNLIRTANWLPPCLRSLFAFVGLRRLALRRRRRCCTGQLRKLALAHAFHELLHLLAPLEQAIDLVDRHAGALRDPLPPGAVDHLRQGALLRRHRQDDGLNAVHLRLVDLVDALELLAHAGNELDEAADRPHPPDHPVALEEVVEGELALHHPRLELLLLVLLHRLLRALDQREHVAHAQDARRHAVRMEILELVDLLADGDELDRSARHGLPRQRRAAARVAVELREDDAVERDALLEGERHVHGLLTGHRVEDEQHVRRLCDVPDALQLVHQVLVDVESSRGVENDRVRIERRDAVAHDSDRVAAVLAVNGYLNLLAKLLELVDRSRALEVGGDQAGPPSLLAQ